MWYKLAQKITYVPGTGQTTPTQMQGMYADTYSANKKEIDHYINKFENYRKKATDFAESGKADYKNAEHQSYYKGLLGTMRNIIDYLSKYGDIVVNDIKAEFQTLDPELPQFQKAEDKPVTQTQTVDYFPPNIQQDVKFFAVDPNSKYQKWLDWATQQTWWSNYDEREKAKNFAWKFVNKG